MKREHWKVHAQEIMFWAKGTARIKALRQEQTCMLMKQKEGRYKERLRRADREAGEASRARSHSHRKEPELDADFSAHGRRDLSREVT